MKEHQSAWTEMFRKPWWFFVGGMKNSIFPPTVRFCSLALCMWQDDGTRRSVRSAIPTIIVWTVCTLYIKVHIFTLFFLVTGLVWLGIRLLLSNMPHSLRHSYSLINLVWHFIWCQKKNMISKFCATRHRHCPVVKGRATDHSSKKSDENQLLWVRGTRSQSKHFSEIYHFPQR